MNATPEAPRSPAVAGLLLTGGASRRMGTDKAALPIDGVPLAERTARLLASLGGPVLEVGPACTGLPTVAEDHPGEGPLAAIAAGARALWERGWQDATVVLACDLPRLTAAVVTLLAGWPGPGAVVPEVAGRLQPLCARWAAADLQAAVQAAAQGQRSLGGLPIAGRHVLTSVDWATVATAADFADADRPEDFLALGLDVPGIVAGARAGAPTLTPSDGSTR